MYIYICPEEINSKQEYRTLSFVYFDTHPDEKLKVLYSCIEFIFSEHIYITITYIIYINCRFKETIKVLDAKQSMYMLKGNKLKQEYRTLSFVYFDTHQLY